MTMESAEMALPLAEALESVPLAILADPRAASPGIFVLEVVPAARCTCECDGGRTEVGALPESPTPVDNVV